MGKPTTWFPNRSDTNQAEQPMKRARSLKFWSKVEEVLYYPSSENKGADQLRSYHEADLCLCFGLCILFVFPWGGSNTKILVLILGQAVSVFLLPLISICYHCVLSSLTFLCILT